MTLLKRCYNCVFLHFLEVWILPELARSATRDVCIDAGVHYLSPILDSLWTHVGGPKMLQRTPELLVPLGAGFIMQGSS